MSYNVVTTEGIRTFENIDDAGDYAQAMSRRIEHCVICGRWWKIYAVSPYLTIWVEVPAWMIWLFWHRIWKTDHKSSHGKEPEQ